MKPAPALAERRRRHVRISLSRLDTKLPRKMQRTVITRHQLVANGYECGEQAWVWIAPVVAGFIFRPQIDHEMRIDDCDRRDA